MPDTQGSAHDDVAEADFRRLAIRLAARGYQGNALDRKISELLVKDVGLRRDVEALAASSA